MGARGVVSWRHQGRAADFWRLFRTLWLPDRHGVCFARSGEAGARTEGKNAKPALECTGDRGQPIRSDKHRDPGRLLTTVLCLLIEMVLESIHIFR